MSGLSRTISIAGKEVEVPVTLWDRVVNWYDPIKGTERYNARARMAISGGYTSADKTRRANQRGSRAETSADGAILPDLQTLREESQHQLRNSPLAIGAIKTNITKVVGSGLKVKAQIDRAALKLSDDQAESWERAAEREFVLATETREIDIERQLPFSLLQGLAFAKVLEDGDLFVNMPRLSRPGSPYKLKLQLIEAARVSNPQGQQDTATLIAGIVKETTGAATACWVCNQHPNGRYRFGRGKVDLKWTQLPMFGKRTGVPQVLHLIDKTRPGQTRGVPYLAPVVELIKQLGRYTDAEVMAAVISGYMTAFVTTDSGSPVIGDNVSENTDPYDTEGMEMGPGSVIGLTPNAKVQVNNPGRPNPAFDPFVMAVLRQIGVALELPFELLIKHFTASYSASRAALMEGWDYFRRRRHWLVTMLCQPVYEAVITEAVATGRLAAPGFFADPLTRRAWLGSNWVGDAPYHLDPLKEIDAAEKRMDLLLTSHEEECAAMPQGGADWLGKMPRIIREQNLIKDAGLGPVEPAPAATPAPAEPDADDTDLEVAP